jgi:hypothetical protein|nr:MAG TPA: hypothetical protein [Caudoviricetes sp.]
MEINVTLKEVSRTRNYRNYKLFYNNEEYYLTVYFGEEFHNKIWECDKEIPEDIAPFVTKVLTRELSEFQARVSEITDIFEDYVIEAKEKGRLPEEYKLSNEELMEIKSHVIDIIYNYK